MFIPPVYATAAASDYVLDAKFAMMSSGVSTLLSALLGFVFVGVHLHFAFSRLAEDPSLPVGSAAPSATPASGGRSPDDIWHSSVSAAS